MLPPISPPSLPSPTMFFPIVHRASPSSLSPLSSAIRPYRCSPPSAPITLHRLLSTHHRPHPYRPYRPHPIAAIVPLPPLPSLSPSMYTFDRVLSPPAPLSPLSSPCFSSDCPWCFFSVSHCYKIALSFLIVHCALL